MFLRALLLGEDPWTAIRHWQALRDRLATRSEPTYDAYPDTRSRPRVRLFLAAFDEADGQVDTEHVDTDDLSAAQFIPGLVHASRRRWLADRVIQAHARLFARLEAGRTGPDAHC